MKVLWETEFKRHLKELLKNQDLETSEIQNMDALLREINYRENERCTLLVEVDDDWDTKIIASLKRE